MLASELTALEQVAGGPATDLAATVAEVSSLLSRAAKTAGFPIRQLQDWLWIGSQYRLHARDGGQVAAASGAALAFLQKSIKRPLQDSDVQDLNWVLETTTKSLRERLVGNEVGRHLSEDEIAEVRRHLEGYGNASFNVEDVRARVAESALELARFATSPLLGSITQKLEALFAATEGESFAAQTARAALLYFADHLDAVSDTYGFLGLLDDVYVIDLAYTLVEQHTRQLPLLIELLQDYPFAASLALVGTPPRPLDLFGQYVCCLCADSLFHRQQPSVVVLREVGAFPLLSAFFAAVQVAHAQGAAERQRLADWPNGQHVIVADGSLTFKVKYMGEVQIGAERRMRIGVDQSGSMTVPLALMPYFSAARVPHKRLSAGKDVGEWLKNRHVDPFVNLTGTSRTRSGDQECILLLGSRSKIERFLPSIRPLDGDVGSTVGLVYATDRHLESIGGTATDTPFIYACSDADVAHDLIRSPPKGVSGWRVVIDGARQMRALLASLTSDGNESNPPICAFADLADRETSSDLEKRGVDILFLQDVDVQPPPDRAPPTTDDPTERVLTRQGAHWNAVRRSHVVPHEFLESIDAWMVRADSARDFDGALQGLSLLVSGFMRSALSRPLAKQQDAERLLSLARSIAGQSSGLRSFSSAARELHEIFEPFVAGPRPSFERRVALASMADESGGRSTAVVCCSAAIAAVCRTEADGDPRLRGMIWTNLEGVRAGPRYDRLLVPGWLDRQSMRELSAAGYSDLTEFLFYPFEKRWFDRTTEAGSRWERRIEVSTTSTLSATALRLYSSHKRVYHWAQPPDLPQEQGPASDIDSPEFEKLEARCVEALHRAALQGRESHPTTKAQLVTFEDPGMHAFLPVGGRVIVLAGPADQSAHPGGPGQAEKLLYRSVPSLEPGWLLAMPVGSDRDLVDARADQFLTKPSETRQNAGIWRTAIKSYMRRTGLDVAGVTRKLAQAGVSRHVMTVRAWISTASTVAPRGYREVLPLLASITGDKGMEVDMPQILQAIDLIYRARLRAAEAIVSELFAGDIDLEAAELRLDHDGATIRYALHRVQGMGAIYDVPNDVVGRLRRPGVGDSQLDILSGLLNELQS